VVGQLMVTYEWSDWRNVYIWWIQSVFVAPEHRGQGIFTGLYHHVRRMCQDEGAGGLRLYADNDNLNAQKTYMRLGMTNHYKVFEDMFDEDHD
jgi:GNAT superfamily N-acetyltransferase